MKDRTKTPKTHGSHKAIASKHKTRAPKVTNTENPTTGNSAAGSKVTGNPAAGSLGNPEETATVTYLVERPYRTPEEKLQDEEYEEQDTQDLEDLLERHLKSLGRNPTYEALENATLEFLQNEYDNNNGAWFRHVLRRFSRAKGFYIDELTREDDPTGWCEHCGSDNDSEYDSDDSSESGDEP